MPELFDPEPPGCPHARVVPQNARWAKCLDCGDDGFPLVDDSPEGDDEPDPVIERLIAQRDALGTALSDLMILIVENNIDVAPFREQWNAALRVHEEWVDSLPDEVPTDGSNNC